MPLEIKGGGVNPEIDPDAPPVAEPIIVPDEEGE